VFGPQKGASREDVALLDGALTRWADVLEAHLDVSVRDRPGAGAAGGLGAALYVLGATQQPGIALVQEAVGLEERVARADLVVTGEGRLDGQSLVGKVVSGVARTAGEHAVPCVVLAGDVQLGRREAAAAGIEQAWSLVDLVGAERALADAGAALAELAAHVAGQWSAGRRTETCDPGRVRARTALTRCTHRRLPQTTSHGGQMTAPETAVPTADTSTPDRRRAQRPRRREGQGPARPGGS
jgi:glycerate kinase